MTYAAITGWGKCMPPTVLTNADLATFLDTDDEWITQRTGIRERRVAHVTGLDLAHVAASRALACAGMRAADLDLVVYGSCSNDEHIPNSASGLSVRLAAGSAAAMVLQASDDTVGVLAEKLGCYSDARGILRVRGSGLAYAYEGNVTYGDTLWDFDGQEIFKRAVVGMGEASAEALARCGKSPADIDLVVPHQANLRIIEFVAKKAGVPMDRVFVTVHKYGNMSSATVPVALVEALEAGRVQPGGLLLTPAFGGGLTFCSHVIRWGERVTPLDASDAELPPCEQSALAIVQTYMQRRNPRGPSEHGLMSPVLAEARAKA